jgi:hypothetical protein
MHTQLLGHPGHSATTGTRLRAHLQDHPGPRSINSSGRFLGAGMALIPFQGSEPPPDLGRFTDSISRMWMCYVTYPCQKGPVVEYARALGRRS